MDSRVRLRRTAAALAAALAAAVPALAGCSPASGQSRPSAQSRHAVQSRPGLAPAPSPPLATPDATVTRTDRSGTAQSIHVSPDGEWLFSPYPDSPWARVVNYGRLDPARHQRLAELLDAAALSGRATGTPVPCRGGYRYRLDAGPVSVSWTDCDTEDQPAFGALLALLTEVEPAF